MDTAALATTFQAQGAESPQSFWQEVWYTMGISWAGAVSVFISTIVLYAFFTLVLTMAGPRLNARPTVLSLGVTLLLGALTARSMLGNSPTLFGGLIAINTLMILEVIFRRWRSPIAILMQRHHDKFDGEEAAQAGTDGTNRLRALDRISGQALVVVADGKMIDEHLALRALTPDLLLTRLRQVGITHLDEVGLVLLEPRGGLTIVRKGDSIDRALIRDVGGAHLIPDHMLR